MCPCCDICDIYKYYDDTYIYFVGTNLERYHTRLTLCTLCGSFATNMMTMCQQLSLIWYVSSYCLVHIVYV